jgi:anti-sigma B factor antagonist
MSNVNQFVEINDEGDVTVVRFLDSKILDETNIAQIGERLFRLVDNDGKKKLVLDFENVEYLSSAALGKLITLDKKAKAQAGRMRLCNIKPGIYEVFAITRLNKVFDIRDSKEDALEDF